MPHINLLPWREELRSERQRQFISVTAGAAILMAVVIFMVHLQIASMISNQNNRNKFLDEQIAIVDKQIAEINTLEQQKKSLLARMKVIQELQGTRPVIVHLFDELAKTIPKQAYLLNINRSGKSISLEGVAQSNDYVSQFMRNLNNSPWLTNPRLILIDSTRKDSPGSSWFQLKVSQADIEKMDESPNKTGKTDNKKKASK